MFPGRKRRLRTSVEAEHLEHFDLAILLVDEMEKRRRKNVSYTKTRNKTGARGKTRRNKVQSW
jgi:hypothetical protein